MFTLFSHVFSTRILFSLISSLDRLQATGSNFEIQIRVERTNLNSSFVSFSITYQARVANWRFFMNELNSVSVFLDHVSQPTPVDDSTTS